MTRRRATLLIGIALVIATAGVYCPVVRHEFVGWDDPETIYENPLLCPPTWHGVAHYWTHGDPGLYAPLTYLFWSALAAVARVEAPAGATELNPAVFHTANLALHVATTLVVFATLREILWWRRRGAVASLLEEETPAAAGALLFALHPLQVESVAWATAGKDLLCGLFSMLALLLYLRWLRDREGAARLTRSRYTGRGQGDGQGRDTRSVAFEEGPHPDPLPEYRASGTRALHYGGAFVCLILALLCKSAAVAVPLLLVVLDRLIVHRPWRAITVAVAPFFLAVIPFVVIAKHFQTSDALPPSPLTWRPIVAADAVGFYVQKLFVPASLTIDYGRTPAAVVGEQRAYVVTGAMTLALIAAAILCAWRGASMPLAGILIFVLAPLPVLGLVPFMFQIHSTVADHYLYLALLGPAIVLCALLARWPRAPIYVLVATVLVVLGVASYRQTRIWRDSVTLFSHAAAVTPASATIHANLANALEERQDPDGSLREYEAAVALDGRNHKARLGLARAYFLRGRYDDAIAQANASLQSLLPGEAPAREFLIIGMSELRLGRYDAAIEALERSLFYDPQNRAVAEQLVLARRMKSRRPAK